MAVLCHISILFWPVYIPWGPHNVIEYNWMYRCYGNYNMDTINSVKGGKNSHTFYIVANNKKQSRPFILTMF